jgi:hypothetical protein
MLLGFGRGRWVEEIDSENLWLVLVAVFDIALCVGSLGRGGAEWWRVCWGVLDGLPS